MNLHPARIAPLLAENTHNWVRSDHLKPASLEMVALVVGAVLVWRYRSGGLMAAYVVSIPFNDVVYRLGPLTPSDVIGLVLLATVRPHLDPIVRPIVPWIIWGFGGTLWVGAPLFGLSYLVRFVIILLVTSTIVRSAEESRIALRAFGAVTILAGAIAVLQAGLWRLGLPIDGVFAAGGFIRPKALSHEPSTAAVFFAQGLALLRIDVEVLGRRMTGWIAAAIVAGLILTASLSGLIIAAVIGAVAGTVQLWRSFTPTMNAAAAGVLVAVALIGGSVAFHSQAGELAGKVERYVEELARGPRPVSIDDLSGREGDLALLAAYPPGWLTGEGVFMAPSLAKSFEEQTGSFAPAANLLITSLIETGVVGMLLLLGGLFMVLLDVSRRYGRRYPELAGGFGGFLVSLLGQRFLAFPQPWFQIALARSVDTDGTSESASEPLTAVDWIPAAARDPSTQEPTQP